MMSMRHWVQWLTHPLPQVVLTRIQVQDQSFELVKINPLRKELFQTLPVSFFHRGHEVARND